MTDLGPDARALLDVARDAHQPSAADKARVKALLAASIAALPATAEAASSSASAPAASAGTSAATTGSALLKIGAAVVAAAGLATAVYVTQLQEPEGAPVPAVEAPASTAPAEVEPAAEATVDVSTLAEQAQRLAEVRVALRDGAFADVLERVDAYESKFPDGMLREEALAARALALCGLGRGDEGRAAREALAEEAPHSAHLGRIDAACD